MPVQGVRLYPDPILKTVCAPVEQIDADALALAADLVDTMRAYPRCVGIAASQIGVALRAIVVDVTDHPKADSCHGRLVLFNPEVILARGAATAREGCLSIPELTGNVTRATEIVVNGKTPSGEAIVVEANAFEARALLHEIDHLDGVLFLDRVTNRETDVFRRRR